MEKMNFADRLNLAMKEGGFTQASLAEAVGMAQPSVWKLTSGKAKATKKILELSRVLGVRPEWLSDGREPMRNDGQRPEPKETEFESDFYRVEVLDVQASAGHGALLSNDVVETIRAIEYTTEQGRALFGGRPATAIKMITVRGDSMEGTINPGDEIFVDMSINEFDGDGIYIFVFGRTLHVKRLQMRKNDLVVISDNPLYKEWMIEEADEDQFYVIAKVLLRQSIEYKRFA